MKGKVMFKKHCRASVVVLVALSIALMSSIAHATPMPTSSDKNYEIAFVTELVNPVFETMTYESLQEIFETTPGSPYTVTWISAQDFHDGYIASSTQGVITDFDLLVWQTDSDTLYDLSRAQNIANAIRKSGIPTVLMDGPGFPLSQVTELIPGDLNGTTYPDVELNPLGRYNSGIGTEWHPLAPFGIDNSEGFYGGADGDDLWIDVAGDTHTVDLVGYNLFTLEGGKFRFTRPVWSANEFALVEYSLSDVALLVDDRRNIIATGFRSPISDWGNVYEYFTDPLSCGWGRYNSINLVHSIFNYVLQPTSTDPPVGQNTFTETDWTVSSVGFDFEVKRTYTSGSSNTDGYLGRNWTSNHDRYLIWDKFNENMLLNDGNGTPILMEMVKGPILENPGLLNQLWGTARPVFTTVNSAVKLTAVYYSDGDIADENRSNFPVSPSPDSNPCTDLDHTFSPAGTEYQVGFLIRDAAGNKAFYARQDIRNTPTEIEGEPAVLYADASTRGGELQKYRITYYEDAAGNRQQYHYTYTADKPEELLWCVIDTEGRGYEFDMQWFTSSNYEPPVPKLLGINTPIRIDEQKMPDIQYWWGVGDRWGFLGSGVDNGIHHVKWMNGEEELNSRSYGYKEEEWGTGGSSLRWNVPLTKIMNRDGTVEKEFEYSEGFEDSYYCMYWYFVTDVISIPTIYPGRLTKTINGSDFGEQKNETTYFHHLKTGIPDINDLSSIWGWTTSVKNGVASTKYINGKSHVVKIFDWYYVDREITENPLDAWGEGMPQSCSIDLDLQPEIDPSTVCEGWTQEFTTNYDGNVVAGTLPSGITKTQTRLIDTVFANEIVSSDYRTADEQMLDFWKDHWYLSYWLSNKIEEATIGTDALEYNKINNYYEPVYNMPFRAEHDGGSVIKEMHYVYMENGGFPGSPGELVATLFPNVPSGSYPPLVNPPYLTTRNFFDVIDASSWTIPFAECDRESPWDTANAPALPYCELLPETTGYGSRIASVTGHSYDEKGREIWFNDPESVPTLTTYSIIGNDSAVIHTRLSGTTQLMEYKLYDWQNRLIQESKGEFDFANGAFIPMVTRDFTYDVVGNTTSTEVKDGAGKVSKRENYFYDEMGNRIVTRFGRCPWDWGGDCAFDYPEMENEVGDWGYHLNAYDSLGREVAACVQVTTDEYDVKKYDCVKTVFQEDGLKFSETRYSDCDFTSDLFNVDAVELDLKNISCPGACSAQETETMYEYDGRNSLYQTTDGAGEIDARYTKRYYTRDGKIGALVDAADSDNSNGSEATLYEYDDRGLLNRETTGLNPDLSAGYQPVSTTYHRTPLGDVAMITQGVPSGASDDQSLGTEGYYIDERRVRTAKTTYQYTIGESPGSDYVFTGYWMDQHDQVVTQETSAGLHSYTTVNHRDGFGRLIGVENGDSNTAVSYGLDALGRIVEQRHHKEAYISSPVKTMTLRAYDALDNVVSSVQVDPDDIDEPTHFQETFNIYDGFGYLVATIDPVGKQNIVTRDGRGNALATYEVLTDVGGDYSYWNNSEVPTNYAFLAAYPTIGISAQYDWRGNVTHRTDAQGNVTQFIYNQFGETEQIIRPDDSFKAFTRNDDGAITQIVYSDGAMPTRIVTNTLDSYNRVASMNVDQEGVSGTTQTFTYWDNGLVKGASDHPMSSYTRDLSSGLLETQINRKWDTLGNLKQDSQNVINSEPNERISNAFYIGMSQTSLERPTLTPTSITNYTWDVAHPSLLLEAKAHVDSLAGLSWTGNKLSSRTLYAGAAEVSMGDILYDIYGNRSQLQVSIDGTPMSDMVYHYDKANRLMSELDGYGKEVIYDLDNLGRVKSYSNSEYGATGVKLDDVDNVRQTWDSNAPPPSSPGETDDHKIWNEGTGESLNQLDSIVFAGAGGSIVYTYDKFGNLETACDSLNGITRNLHWDNMGRLIAVVDDNGSEAEVIAEYVYDALGRRVAKYTSDGTQVQYALFGDDVVEEYREDIDDAVAVLQIHHDLTHTDRYFRWDEYSVKRNRIKFLDSYMPVHDARNNVTMIVNSSGQIEDALEYGLYGDHYQPNDAWVYPYTFSGRRYDPETGMMYYRTRYYSAQMKRFISLDTIGIWGDMNNYGNGYAYVGGMVNGGLDPSGLHEIGTSLEVVGALLGVAAVKSGQLSLAVAAAVSFHSGLVLNHQEAWENEIRQEFDLQMERAKDALDRYVSAMKDGNLDTAKTEAKKAKKALEEAEKIKNSVSVLERGLDGDDYGLTPEDIHDIQDFIRRQSSSGIQYQYMIVERTGISDELPMDWWQWDGIEEMLKKKPRKGTVMGNSGGNGKGNKAQLRRRNGALLPTIKFTMPEPAYDGYTDYNNPDNFTGQIWGAGWLGVVPSMQDELNSLSNLTNGKVGPQVDPPPFSSMHVHFVVYTHVTAGP